MGNLQSRDYLHGGWISKEKKNPKLWAEVLSDIKKKNPGPWAAWKAMKAVQEYKKRGGKYGVEK
jgi:hypothetical protein